MLIVSVEEDLSRDEVPDGDEERCEELRDQVMHTEKLHACPHACIVDPKADERADEEEQEFARFGHVLAVPENESHRSEVIEHRGDHIACRRAYEVVDAEYLREEGKQAIIHRESDDSHNAEFHELGKQLLHAPKYITVGVFEVAVDRICT